MKILGEEGFLLLRGLAPRDRRAILLGLAVMVVAASYVLGVRPYREALAGVRDRVQAERELLTRELALLESASEIPEAIHRA
jgi:type II secretory pathway component PulM